MKKLLYLFIVMSILLTGCTSSTTMQKKSSEQLKEYRTLLSPNNELSIVRKPSVADYSRFNPGKMTELPKYNPDSDELWQMDLRSSDLTDLDLEERFEDLIYADFNSQTQWPNKLPDNFDPQMIMKLGKNPGLGLRKLHRKGITGKGVGLAIIDQGLLVDHVEYKKQLKMYEEIHCNDREASMHGPAVASIAVGKTIGVAPKADLYYIAETHGNFKGEKEFEWDLTWLADSIDRIVEINKTLPKDKKIRVISISLGINKRMNGYEKALDSIEKAKQEGIYTVYVGSDPYSGLGRNPLKSADDITSYTKGEFWKDAQYDNSRLLIPMDSRCTASPTGVKDYVFYRKNGMSWTVPYVAGLYALACQVKPDITPDVFWEEAFNTSGTVSVGTDGQDELGKIVNPVKLIEKLEKMK